MIIKVYQIGKDDLKAFETFLEGKKFLMGNKPCNEDASLFGMLCQVMFNDKSILNQYLKSKLFLKYNKISIMLILNLFKVIVKIH